MGIKAMVGETGGVSPCCCKMAASTATGCWCIPRNRESVLIFLVLVMLAPSPELDGRGGRGATTLVLEEDILNAFCSADDIERAFHARVALEASVATLLSACASTSKHSSAKRAWSHCCEVDCIGPRELMARRYGAPAPLFEFRTTALVMMAKCFGTSSKWGKRGTASLCSVGTRRCSPAVRGGTRRHACGPSCLVH
jgi:hypothetical protein